MNCIQARFNSLLSHNTNGACPAPLLTPQLANALIERLERMRLSLKESPTFIRLKALKRVCDNPTQSLWPGQLVNVEVQTGLQRDALVVPPQVVAAT